MTGLFDCLRCRRRQRGYQMKDATRRAAREERALGGPADGRRALDHAMIDPTAVVQRGDAISLRPFRRHE